MINFKKLILTSTISLGALFCLTNFQSSANQRPHSYYSTNKSISVYHPVNRQSQANQITYGEMRHSYGNWTLNGKNTLWTLPLNNEPRHTIISTRHARSIARHARNQQNPDHLFYLDYTATYQNHARPSYYYVESYSERLHGWIYYKGLVQAGRNNNINIDNISSKDIYTPNINHITKTDYENAEDIKAELLSDLLNNNRPEYRNDLNYAYWEAMNLGTIKHHVRKQKVQMIKRAVHDAAKMLQRAQHSRKYMHYLKKQLNRY